MKNKTKIISYLYYSFYFESKSGEANKRNQLNFELTHSV